MALFALHSASQHCSLLNIFLWKTAFNLRGHKQRLDYETQADGSQENISRVKTYVIRASE